MKCIVLTDEELWEITRRTSAVAQGRVLRLMGIPFKPHPSDPRLLVSRAAAEVALGGTVPEAPANDEYSVDLEAIRTHGKKTHSR